jgi:hypothetical protein
VLRADGLFGGGRVGQPAQAQAVGELLEDERAAEEEEAGERAEDRDEVPDALDDERVLAAVDEAEGEEVARQGEQEAE